MEVLLQEKKNIITFSTNDGEEVEWVSYGKFFNAYVRSNIEKISGICSEEFIRSRFFHHFHGGRKLKVEHRECKHRHRHVETCKKRGLKGRRLEFCVVDLCSGLDKRIVKRILRRNRHEKKKVIKPVRVEKKS